MTDRHKVKPKAVRMAGGLLDWYRQHAGATGRSVNGAIVAALEDYRRRQDSGGQPAAPAEPTKPAVEQCPHPSAEVAGGYCKACRQDID